MLTALWVNASFAATVLALTAELLRNIDVRPHTRSAPQASRLRRAAVRVPPDASGCTTLTCTDLYLRADAQGLP